MPPLEFAAIIGSKGMLAADLLAALRRAGCRTLAGDYPEADITNAAALRRFFAGARPQVIFNCAAMTDVDGCETKRAQAFAINAEGAGTLAAAAADLGAVLVHLSTDFVFDGRKGAPYAEEDAPAPLSAYAESKLAGEEQVRAKGGHWIIARTAWLYGRGRTNFVDRMLQLGRERAEVSVVTDQVGSPTWSRDLAAALVALATARAQGVFHVVNSGACSRYEQVQALYEYAGLRTRVRPADSSAFARPARVPAYSVLSVDKLRRHVGHAMRPWQEALREYVREIRP